MGDGRRDVRRRRGCVGYSFDTPVGNGDDVADEEFLCSLFCTLTLCHSFCYCRCRCRCRCLLYTLYHAMRARE